MELWSENKKNTNVTDLILKEITDYLRNDQKRPPFLNDGNQKREEIKAIIPPKKNQRKTKESLNGQLRNLEITQQILKKMTAHVFVSFIEEQLSRSIHYWIESGIQPPLDKQSYTWWFCLEQSKFYGNLAKKIINEDVYYFIKEHRDYFSSIKKRSQLLKELCGEEVDNSLYKNLKKFEREIVELQLSSISSSTPPFMDNLRSQLVSHLYDIEKTLKVLSKESMSCIKSN